MADRSHQDGEEHSNGTHLSGLDDARLAPSVAAIVPAYNEGRRVVRVIQEIQARGLPVIVVDDGSRDDTAGHAAAAGATVLRQERNQGKGAALKAGFRHALADGYEAIITLDADGQHDPAEIPLFLEAFQEHHFDLIIGARNFDDMPWTRYTMNMLGRWTLTWLLGEPMHDNQSGYRLLSRRLAEASLQSEETGYEFEVEMIVICRQGGFKLGWVPIRTIYNDEQSHINHVQHVVNYARLLWRVRQEMKG